MKSGRLEAFSDGVIAIIITIMVLEISVPEGDSVSGLISLIPVILSYIVSFLYVGIYWNNHHHLFQATEKVNGRILWANLHLLFWLSLIPFTTAWLGRNHESTLPLTIYGVVLIGAAIAYFILQRQIFIFHDDDFQLRRVIGTDRKGKISILFYAIGIAASFFNAWIAIACYVAVAIMWFIPDKRIEKILD